MDVFVGSCPNVVTLAPGGGVAGPGECPGRDRLAGRRCQLGREGRGRLGDGGRDMDSMEILVHSHTLFMMVHSQMLTLFYLPCILGSYAFFGSFCFSLLIWTLRSLQPPSGWRQSHTIRCTNTDGYHYLAGLLSLFSYIVWVLNDA